MKEKTRILLADDHPLVRKGMATVITSDPEYSIVAECEDGTRALKDIAEWKPDIAILDVSMPGMDGFEVMRRTNRNTCPTKFIMLTLDASPECVEQALALGVDGYVLKESAIHELLDCLKAVRSGKKYLSPALSAMIVSWQSGKKKLSDSVPGLNELTPTEKQILKMILENKTSRQIADELFVSHRTIQNHRDHMCKKLGLEGHNKLLEFALKNKNVIE